MSLHLNGEILSFLSRQSVFFFGCSRRKVVEEGVLHFANGGGVVVGERVVVRVVLSTLGVV